MTLASKVVKIDSKIIISLHKSKSVTHSVRVATKTKLFFNFFYNFKITFNAVLFALICIAMLIELELRARRGVPAPPQGGPGGLADLLPPNTSLSRAALWMQKNGNLFLLLSGEKKSYS